MFLSSQNLINLRARREKDEIIFESSIPSQYILGYQIFSLPSFNSEWTVAIHQHYGLDENTYKYFQKLLLDNSDNLISCQQHIENLITTVTAFQFTKTT